MSRETEGDRFAALEKRLRDLEDRQEIADLIASYGPLVDAGAAPEVAALWTEDGLYDVDEAHLEGREQLDAMVRSRNHQGWINGGCAHFHGQLKVTLAGDEAVAVCHTLMIVNRGGDFEQDPDFFVRRATAHHFALVRGDTGWLIRTRTSRVLDGRALARELLEKGATGQPL